MNILEQIWQSNEGRYKEIIEARKKLLLSRFYVYVKKSFGQEAINELVSKKLDVESLIMGNDIFFQDIQNIITNYIVSTLSTKNLIGLFIQYLTNTSLKKDLDLINILIESIKNLGLVNDITYNENSKMFTIKCLDNKKFKFTNMAYSIEEMEAYMNNCHDIVLEYAKVLYEKKQNVNIVSFLHRNYLNCKMYHTIFTLDSLAYDPARNIIAPKREYIKILNPYVLVNEKFDSLEDNIERLSRTSSEFVECSYCPLLKYTLYKQSNL